MYALRRMYITHPSEFVFYDRPCGFACLDVCIYKNPSTAPLSFSIASITNRFYWRHTSSYGIYAEVNSDISDVSTETFLTAVPFLNENEFP